MDESGVGDPEVEAVTGEACGRLIPRLASRGVERAFPERRYGPSGLLRDLLPTSRWRSSWQRT